MIRSPLCCSQISVPLAANVSLDIIGVISAWCTEFKVLCHPPETLRQRRTTPHSEHHHRDCEQVSMR